jgi:ABC-type transport system involved in cytochrome bd biosynthesis fused ATPase/permease subunit
MSCCLAILSAFVTKASEKALHTHSGFLQSATACTPIESECGGTGPVACNLTVYQMHDPNDNSKCLILLTKRDP